MLLKAWLLLGLAVVTGWFIWNFVPVLIPMAAVLAGLGAIAFAMVRLARWIERARGLPPRMDQHE
ncbi:MAG TPA: hypothetical protein PK264_10220 [Hyphomicrobiaceae bacterium]|nr:hypothetical protein [Hyphomicrobiaceae bacterium]